MQSILRTTFFGLATLSYTLTAAHVSASPAQPEEVPPSRPSLVVGLVVDQMRWDYLHRFAARYGKGGFQRLLRDGFSCDNTHINYIPTVTAIGHASIYTGSVPSIHGITGNEFIDQATGKSVYCTEDDSVSGVGATTDAGKNSPRNLLANTVADELKLATNFRSKVVGISLKDRGAILPAGHTADAAYWFDDEAARWITSTYYRPDLPNWAAAFNETETPAKYLANPWETLYPIETYTQSVPDENPYERPLQQDVSQTFPIVAADYPTRGASMIRLTPAGNSYSLAFAKAAIAGEKLGQREVTDFLAVSLSAPDSAGHVYGINSPKMEDLYLRLDRELSDFFDYLDKTIGVGRYTLFLTADHGGGHNVQFQRDHKLPGGQWDQKLTVKLLNRMLAQKYQTPGLVIENSACQINFNHVAILAGNLDGAAIREDCLRFLKARDGVAYVVESENVAGSPVPNLIKQRLINGYNAERSGSILIVLKPGWSNGMELGSTHSAWNPYDSHIPLLWMGWGIKPGRSVNPTSITDIAPTVAMLLQIQAPNGCIGNPIVEVLGHQP